ncbi:MAG: hypothetical protein HOV68_02175, partial [Streptomycetaceae bacterium]|nr:hypothetical protein [Streptomycetaceae bacterium]
ADARWIRESRHRVDLRRSDELSAVFEAGREARNERLAGRVRMAEHNTDVGLSRTYDVPYRDGAGDEQHVRTVMTGQGGMRMLPVDPRATAEQKADKLDPRPPQNQAGATPSEAATPAPDAARASGGRSLPMPTGVVAPEASAATKGLAKVGQAQAWTPPVVKSPARAEPVASPWAGKIHAHHRETVRVTRGPGVSLDKPVSPARPERGTALNMERD